MEVASCDGEAAERDGKSQAESRDTEEQEPYDVELAWFLGPRTGFAGGSVLAFPHIVDEMKRTCHIGDVGRARIRDK